MLLIVIPWSAFWEHNYFAETWPALQTIVTNNFVRGAISGLGVVNLIAGFAELSFVFERRVRRDVTVRDPTSRPL